MKENIQSSLLFVAIVGVALLAADVKGGHCDVFCVLSVHVLVPTHCHGDWSVIISYSS